MSQLTTSSTRFRDAFVFLMNAFIELMVAFIRL